MSVKGFFSKKVTYANGTFDSNLLLNDQLGGVDDFKPSWYPVPLAKVIYRGVEFHGTYKHADCMKFARGENKTCEKCKMIPNLQSFKRRLILRAEKIDEDGKRNLHSIRFEYLSQSEAVEVLREKNKSIEKKDADIFFMKQKNLRLKIRVRNLKEKLKEFGKRGDMKAICHQLVLAESNGSLADKKVLVDTLETVANNFHVQGAKGKRYKQSVRNFYESLLIMGGPKLCNFVSINLGGPSTDAVYKWRKLQMIKFKPGLLDDNFQQLAQLVKSIMVKHSVPKVPWLLAEDETSIEKVATYHQETDELLGFCGRKTDNPKQHKCLADIHIVIGDDETSYDRLKNAFENYKIGSYARVMILNPMHTELPRLVACLLPTCNRFNHADVFRQWEDVDKKFKLFFEDHVGPLVGHSSDGDSRRRKLMVQMMTSEAGERFSPIPPELGFIFTTRQEIISDSFYSLSGMGDQDPIHNHKKFVNHLDSVSRTVRIGPGLVVLMNHIELVLKQFPVLRHGLNKDHVRRERDRQNWKVAQEITSL